MLRKTFLPIVYFIFGVFIFFIEDLTITFITKNLEISTKLINIFNRYLFIIVAIILLLFEARPIYLKTEGKVNKIIYSFVTLFLITIIAIYWINTTTWK